MNRDRCCDLSFGLSAQALAVGQLLAVREPSFADYGHRYRVLLTTRPWYNGRERGLCFIMKPDFKGARVLYLAVFESRGSDEIAVEQWTEDMEPWNEGSLSTREKALGSEADEAVYRNRRQFGYGQVGKVADYVFDRMRRHYLAEEKLFGARKKEARCDQKAALG